jgi:hypothetical protein
VGSEEKVRYLVDVLEISRDHIFSSRNAGFVSDLMEVTDGRGADVVLNSLSGELLHASWRCVAEFGKLVELGKTDLIGHAQLDMEPFSSNRSYCGIDLVLAEQILPVLVAGYVIVPRARAGGVTDGLLGGCHNGCSSTQEGPSSLYLLLFSRLWRLFRASDIYRKETTWEKRLFWCHRFLQFNGALLYFMNLESSCLIHWVNLMALDFKNLKAAGWMYEYYNY